VSTTNRLASRLIGIGAAAAVGALAGCSMPNSSNPTLSITRAQMLDGGAALDMRIDNPSDMDVRVTTIDWTLVHGPLPVADGQWEVGELVPSRGALNLSRRVAFTGPVLDPGEQMELSGVMSLEDQGGSGKMSLHEASFRTTGRAR